MSYVCGIHCSVFPDLFVVDIGIVEEQKLFSKS
jgi:hypothetical protein